MKTRIGINGFGRIGKAVTRLIQARTDLELVAINEPSKPDQIVHGLKYDSVYGRFPGEIRIEADALRIGSDRVQLSAETDPGRLDWAGKGVDYVIEATGKFRTRTQLEAHLKAGARKVVLSVPAKDALDATIVFGVNDQSLTGREQLISCASCTTNAAAPVTKIIHDCFGVVRGYINTIHAYTNDQNLVDFPHKDPRRSRAATLSIIPTTTGAARAVASVIPDLVGKLEGVAYRVPVPVGSIADMVFELEKTPTVAEINQAVYNASQQLTGVLQYLTDPIVSSDIVGNSHSSIFDSLLTQIIEGNMIKVAAWYDNESGYACRLLDLAARMTQLERG